MINITLHVDLNQSPLVQCNSVCLSLRLFVDIAFRRHGYVEHGQRYVEHTPTNQMEFLEGQHQRNVTCICETLNVFTKEDQQNHWYMPAALSVFLYGHQLQAQVHASKTLTWTGIVEAVVCQHAHEISSLLDLAKTSAHMCAHYMSNLWCLPRAAVLVAPAGQPSLEQGWSPLWLQRTYISISTRFDASAYIVCTQLTAVNPLRLSKTGVSHFFCSYRHPQCTILHLPWHEEQSMYKSQQIAAKREYSSKQAQHLIDSAWYCIWILELERQVDSSLKRQCSEIESRERCQYRNSRKSDWRGLSEWYDTTISRENEVCFIHCSPFASKGMSWPETKSNLE